MMLSIKSYKTEAFMVYAFIIRTDPFINQLFQEITSLLVPISPFRLLLLLLDSSSPASC
jgi:hypothetical protein